MLASFEHHFICVVHLSSAHLRLHVCQKLKRWLHWFDQPPRHLISLSGLNQLTHETHAAVSHYHQRLSIDLCLALERGATHPSDVQRIHHVVNVL